MKMLDIAEVAERAGVLPSALRYYEKVGLIVSAARHGLRRQYEPAVIDELALIAVAKSAGFSLEEIGRFMGRGDERKIPRAALNEKADQLEKQIEKLTTLVRMLRHVADCPKENHFECNRFRKLLKVTSRIT